MTIAENGVVFGAFVPGTFKITAKAGDFTAVTKVTVTNVIQSVNQTALTEIKAVFQGDISKYSFLPKDFTLLNKNGKPVAIKEVKKTGAKEVSISTTEKMKYGATYTVTYEENPVSVKATSFKATMGQVISLDIEPNKAIVQTPTDVTVSTKDANGTVIDIYKLGDSNLPEELSFTVNPKEGSVNDGGQLILASISDTAEAEAIYKAEDGTEIRKKITISASPAPYASPAPTATPVPTAEPPEEEVPPNDDGVIAMKVINNIIRFICV